MEAFINYEKMPIEIKYKRAILYLNRIMNSTFNDADFLKFIAREILLELGEIDE